ncbi:hypothetical protein LPJ78_004699 [Coemansia sp. RSA 989]|nr:hypothetical protein BX667DRAFT_514470 [Coemansia mojavensis]KAJ1739075.1 hypothetical protein LPJ68_004999 [Coemansia sp. RSA 1086]KAJ1747547.1 hypothetical protein LPJ79_005175 [Coemansia sp. RSA 1821]KAJ1862474.1 hypothetical protein LPJ78_004699 [Coemansia sp. RSA 989]KAJ1869528.1 hypothetical protein LPJ55_005301 [Coemansia sp. RSA 990]KAJ2648294.1 hypothetical protein IWW40_004047 [Coemansia sp. RSA 1250]KAJ2670515.1 hypothetical protein IWW42_003948 [Coemansia sp. RSA 1085]
MKIAFVSLALAAIGLAQDEMSTPPAVAPTVAPMEMPTPMPQVSMPQVSTPYEHMERSVYSLISRLMSFFDLSNVDANLTSAPVAMAHVYDPRSGKFVMLSMPVIKSGEAYYMPACPVGVTSNQPLSVSENAADCGYGIQLTPMPRNTAALLFRVLRTKARMLLDLAKPSFWTQVQTSM